MKTELELISEHVLQAKNPEAIFGQLQGKVQEKLDKSRGIFRQLAKATHPDTHPEIEKQLASFAFSRLNLLWQEAQKRINSGIYGNGFRGGNDFKSVIKMKRFEYHIEEEIFKGSLTNIFWARKRMNQKTEIDVILKIARESADNDLIENEARILRKLRQQATEEKETFLKYLPEIENSFRIENEKGEKLAVNSLLLFDGFYTFGEVMEAYPNGVNPRDGAWMWNRTLEILGFIHREKVIHGALIPEHVLIHPVTHRAVLIDFSAAIEISGKGRSRIRVIHDDFLSFYAPEILNRETPDASTDIYMSALVMMALLGGDLNQKTLPKTVPEDIGKIIFRCANPDRKIRPKDAWEVRETFEKVLKRVFGPRKYHEFEMP